MSPGALAPEKQDGTDSHRLMIYFLTRSGRCVPERDTDQAGTDMLVRTVSAYTDGAPLDRPQICVSPELTAGDPGRACRMAADLDRRGYLPPDPPMTRAEWGRIAAERKIAPDYMMVIWDVLGRGVPAGTALARAGIKRERRRRVQRIIKDIGWGESEEDEA